MKKIKCWIQIVLVMALLLSTWFVGGTFPIYANQEDDLVSDQEYIERINDVLRQDTDVWGEYLMSLPEGPTYENIKDYLHPLMFVGKDPDIPGWLTESGIYYIPFGMLDSLEGGQHFALTVADGSEIISDKYDSGRKTLFYVGKDGSERFGSALSRWPTPTLEDGYLPILKNEYTDVNGVKYFQESFATYIDETESLVSFVKFTVNQNHSNETSTKIVIESSDTDLKVSDNLLVSSTDETAYFAFSKGGVYDGSLLTYDLDISDGKDKVVYIARLNNPTKTKKFPLNGGKYKSTKKKLIRYWQDKLEEGAQISVPEDRVNHAMKNLLLQNLQMTWRYGIGNFYEDFYVPESSDNASVLGQYGFPDEELTALKKLLHSTKYPGTIATYSNWEQGEKMAHAVEHYYRTKDPTYIMENKQTFIEFAEDFAQQIEEDPNGLLEKQSTANDLGLPVYGMNAQLVAWRGLRDISTVWGELGEAGLEQQYSQIAEQLRQALREAIDESKVTLSDGSLYIPTNLLDEEYRTPYDPITETKDGSYWNLVAHYGFASGFFEPKGEEANKVLQYLHNHGATLLGMIRFNYYPTPIGEYTDPGYPGYRTPGVDNVYMLHYSKFLAQNDLADRLVLSFYGKLAHGFTRNTFINGEGDEVGVFKNDYYRSMYLPPDGPNNSSFLTILRLMLVQEDINANGQPDKLHLGYATPRGWLENGKEIKLSNVPTSFGKLAYNIKSHLNKGYIDVRIDIPERDPIEELKLRLRAPNGYKITKVTSKGKSYDNFNAADETIDLTGQSGKVKLRVFYN